MKLYRQGRWHDARAGLEKHLSVHPDDIESRFRLADIHGHLNDFAGAKNHLRMILALRNDIPEVYFMLGMVLQAQALYEQSIDSFTEAMRLRPSYTDACAQRGVSYYGLKQLFESEQDFKEVIRQSPGHAVAYRYLPTLYKYQGRLDEAEDFYRTRIEQNASDLASHTNLALMLTGQCRIDEAIESCHRALAVDPEYTAAHSNLCFAMNYLLHSNPADIRRVHERAGRAYAQRATQVLQRLGAAGDKKNARLKIGYVSPDFRLHAVAFFIEPLLTHHDPSQFEIICYSTTTRRDNVTEKLKQSGVNWVDAAPMTEAALTTRIRSDEVDILVDLSGHTGDTRLGVFATRAAPIQVTYLGYPNTTGLPSMDYRLTDAIADPPDADRYHTERLLRLAGGFLCYLPFPESPPVARTKRDVITFGSFNHQPKINPEVIRTWVAILNAVPGSRLVLKNSAIAHGTTAQRCRDAFGRHGIRSDRLVFLESKPLYADHLATYHEIDVALDPFPYNGTTTTFDSIFMGVPVITLAGDRHAGRVGQSILTHLQLEELIACDERDYIRKAVELSGDEQRLNDYRSALRERMLNSPLCDGARIAREVETAFRQMLTDHGNASHMSTR